MEGSNLKAKEFKYSENKMSSKFVGFKIYFYTLLLLLRFVADLGVSF